MWVKVDQAVRPLPPYRGYCEAVKMADAQKSEKPSRFQEIEEADAQKSEKSLQVVFTDGACTDNGKDDARAAISVFGTMKMIETCQS